ncbi:MAG: hypothetical protein COW16_13545 [Sphingomonadales bacterium CG12_big_fil_rev_8_21_14_0_65_65_10]|jgi:hypothetical protein|uniref:hypothetical protein n=1 Tax=Blastomonas marina TaxID=1867408 RepID=UPI000CB0434B|nr:hypothetical protein [Blastomonas marina]PIW54008.1 MAG: hypothetical protein COW16_13545 [Sphingomonadales bacterium CG12_big_fil_rev_8_21_14_0_65_65_10]WPZ04476.1 hypothetical protein T8S45_02745 [Blastomonas marina]
MSNPDKDPTKPTPNDEKFKPQNVADPQSTVEPPSRDADKPANSDGKDIPAGSQADIAGKSRNRV